jgi:dolichyl-phosphate-mannose-protein mannosyltransferase
VASWACDWVEKNGRRRSNALTILCLCILTGGALAFRLALAWRLPPHYDVLAFASWLKHLQKVGLTHAYDRYNRNRYYINYPPIAVYLLALLQPFLRLPAAKLYFALRISGIIADTALVPTLYWIGRQLGGKRLAALAIAATWAIQPAAWFDSAVWGQTDALPTLLSVAAAGALLAEAPGWAGLLLALAILDKPTVIFLLPAMLVWLAARHQWRSIVRALAGMAAGALVTLEPYLLLAPHQLIQLWQNIHDSAARYGIISAQAANVWWLVRVWAPGQYTAYTTEHFWGPLTMGSLSTLLTGLVMLAILIQLWRHPTRPMLIAGLAVTALVTYLLLTAMHERYGLPALPFFAILAVQRGRWRWLYAAFSLTQIIQLVLVWTPQTAFTSSTTHPWHLMLIPILALLQALIILAQTQGYIHGPLITVIAIVQILIGIAAVIAYWAPAGKTAHRSEQTLPLPALTQPHTRIPSALASREGG